METGEGSRDAVESSGPGEAWGPPSAWGCIHSESLQGTAVTDPPLPKAQACCEGNQEGKRSLHTKIFRRASVSMLIFASYIIAALALFSSDISYWMPGLKHLEDNSATAYAFFDENHLLCVKT